MDTVKLIIDNREIEVPKGTTILKAAQKMGIDIPTLCHFELEGLGVHNKPGGCRICVVEVEKRRNLAPACVTDCMDGTHQLRGRPDRRREQVGPDALRGAAQHPEHHRDHADHPHRFPFEHRL